jgi:hypothetical protein
MQYFDNDLTGEKCTIDRYNKALKVWDELRCTSFLDYHMAYLKSDTVLLSEVFMNYRENFMKMFGLDPVRFVSVQSMTMTNWLKYSGVAIGLISDKTMYDFFHSAIRGGMCSVGELTFANVHNKTDETIIGFDMNALYPTAMLFPLPCGEFSWVDVEEAKNALETYDIYTSDYGYYYEVDIEVPKELHSILSAYPLFPEMIDGKLKATLYDKKNYIVHIYYLQVGLKLGYKVTNVHRAIKFKQAPIMRDYITMLALERKKHPKGTFLNDLYKLMANSLFGKTIENPDNYRDHKVAIGDADIVKLLNNRRLKNFHILDDECETVLAELVMNKVSYNKPIAIGCSILDISKAYMAYFYYGCLKPYYKDNM